jgi:hypothetical protein
MRHSTYSSGSLLSPGGSTTIQIFDIKVYDRDVEKEYMKNSLLDEVAGLRGKSQRQIINIRGIFMVDLSSVITIEGIRGTNGITGADLSRARVFFTIQVSDQFVLTDVCVEGPDWTENRGSRQYSFSASRVKILRLPSAVNELTNIIEEEEGKQEEIYQDPSLSYVLR